MLEVIRMSEQIFFVIDEKELVLDKVLVEFNETPIFFVCKFEQNYFISSCLDIDKERYLVAQVGLSSLSKMLHEKMTMRNLILQAYSFWDITVGEDITKDIVVKKSAETISLDELPYEGEYLTLATKDLEKYAEKIDSILYDEGVWEEESSEDIFFQFCDEIFDTIKTISVQYENICESVIKNLKKSYFKNDDEESEYSKEVCNEEIKFDTKNTGLKVKINNESSWAA